MADSILRKARAGEESAIHEAHMRSIREVCVKDHGEEEIRGWGHRPLGNRWTEAIREGSVWVVEHDDAIHGLGALRVLAEEHSKCAHLLALYFTPEILGRGLGSKMMEILLQHARSAGVESITLESTLTARGFYSRWGFKETGPQQRLDIGGYPVSYIPMRLDLNTYI